MNNQPPPPAARPIRPRSVSRALAYPYDVPDRSFVIHAGHVQPVESETHFHELAGGDLEGRVPVIACGSNQAPSALAWKFSRPEDGPVPVVRLHLKNFDSVYCAHFAGYGSVPATLHPAPGTVVSLFVNWLTPAQLAHMHTTETRRGTYDSGELAEIETEVEFGPAVTRAGAYICTRGALAIDGCPVPLAEIPARDRVHPALGQRALIERLLALHGLADTVETFVQRNIDDEGERSRRAALLHLGALPFDYPAFHPAG
ncbi:MAG: hypothetical protein RLO49_12895 [Rhodospirillales bacterium]